MPQTHRLPSYRLHKASGQAIVTLVGRDHYLGRHGSRASRDLFDRLLKEWLANDRAVPARDGPTVIELLAAFNDHAKVYYAPRPGSIKSEYYNFRSIIRVLKDQFGGISITDFGPNKLRTVVEEMIRRGWTRGVCNAQLHRAQRIFRWGVSREMVPVEVYQALLTVDSLRRGRTVARDNLPVEAVAEKAVRASLPYMNRQVAAMVQIQWRTGMRPGEVVRMRESELRQEDGRRLYEFEAHKTAGHRLRRIIVLDEVCMGLIEPFRKVGTDAFFFSPADAEKERRQALHVDRKTPLSCGNRPGSNRKHVPQRQPGPCYTVDSYATAIRKACVVVAGGVPPELAAAPTDTSAVAEKKRRELRVWTKRVCWRPNQLRHAAGFRIRREEGLDAAQIALGHTTVRTTERYAPPDVSIMQEARRRAG